MYKFLSFLFLVNILSAGCGNIQPTKGVDNGLYTLKHKEKIAALNRINYPEKYNNNVWIEEKSDTLNLYFLDKIKNTEEHILLTYQAAKGLKLVQQKLDIDVFTIPFKVRLPKDEFPPQLNSNFNAALYIGKRYDRYKIDYQQFSPFHTEKMVKTRGVGFGAFLGLGSTTMNSFVTTAPITKEYDGLLVLAGVAGLYDVKIFNVGLAVGIDHLLDYNRNVWVYQHQPWFGILFSLDLN